MAFSETDQLQSLFLAPEKLRNVETPYKECLQETIAFWNNFFKSIKMEFKTIFGIRFDALVSRKIHILLD